MENSIPKPAPITIEATVFAKFGVGVKRKNRTPKKSPSQAPLAAPAAARRP